MTTDVDRAIAEREKQMTFKSAMLGCGPRAEVHATAYDEVSEARLAAACDIDKARLEGFGEKFRISGLYGDFEQMLVAERPDIVHVVTPPAVRAQPIELAARYGVRGIIVEKPLALRPSQARTIRQVAERAEVRIVVNMQRRYMPSCQELRQVIKDGKIGDVTFARCVAKGNILAMGPHAVDLILFFLDDVAPTQVWAAAYDMNGHDIGHPAAANVLAAYTLPGQVVVYLEESTDAVGTVGEPSFWQHLELDIWGTKGRAWWLQNRDWGYHCEGMARPHVGKTCWADDDQPAQSAFTRALVRWLQTDEEVHLNCLENSLRGFDVIMATLKSAGAGKRIELPTDVSDEIVDGLERRLESAGSERR